MHRCLTRPGRDGTGVAFGTWRRSPPRSRTAPRVVRAGLSGAARTDASRRLPGRSKRARRRAPCGSCWPPSGRPALPRTRPGRPRGGVGANAALTKPGGASCSASWRRPTPPFRSSRWRSAWRGARAPRKRSWRQCGRPGRPGRPRSGGAKPAAEAGVSRCPRRAVRGRRRAAGGRPPARCRRPAASGAQWRSPEPSA